MLDTLLSTAPSRRAGTARPVRAVPALNDEFASWPARPGAADQRVERCATGLPARAARSTAALRRPLTTAALPPPPKIWGRRTTWTRGRPLERRLTEPATSEPDNTIIGPATHPAPAASQRHHAEASSASPRGQGSDWTGRRPLVVAGFTPISTYRRGHPRETPATSPAQSSTPSSASAGARDRRRGADVAAGSRDPLTASPPSQRLSTCLPPVWLWPSTPQTCCRRIISTGTPAPRHPPGDTAESRSGLRDLSNPVD